MSDSRTSAPTLLSDLLFEQAGVGLCLVAPGGTIMRANSDWLRSTGHTLEQVIGKDIVALFPDAHQLRTTLRTHARDDEKVMVPPHQIELQGHPTWCEGSVSPVPMDGGTGFLITARDITEQVARGREPNDFDALYHALFEHSLDGVLLTKPDGTILRANPAACRMFGLPEAEVCRLKRDARVVDDAATRAFLAERERKGAAKAELTHRRGDGSLFPAEVTSAVILTQGGERFTYVIVRDLTEQRHGEEAKARLAAIVEGTEDAIISKDLGGTILTWNVGAQRLFGYCAEDAIGRPIAMLLPADRQNEENEILRQLQAGRRLDHFETKRLTKDGVTVEVSVTVSPLRDANGGIIGASQIARDITERKRAERALRESERYLSLALEGSNDGCWSLDLAANQFTFSDRIFEVVGERPQGPMSSAQFWWDRVHQDDVALVHEALNAHLRGNTHRIDVEYRLRSVDGAWKWVRALGMVVEKGAAGRPTRLAGTLRDVTERHEANNRLRVALAENENLVAELREALHNVKTLSGLLPICAWCHNIRNDAGYWQRIETYVSQNTAATFTHGMCPDCFNNHYATNEGAEGTDLLGEERVCPNAELRGQNLTPRGNSTCRPGLSDIEAKVEGSLRRLEKPAS